MGKRMSSTRQSQENSPLEGDILFLSNISGPAFCPSFLMGCHSWVGVPDHLLWSKMKRNREAEKGMELKDGTLFVIFKQFIKEFILGVTDETCDSRDSRAHRPRKNFSC